MGGYNSGRWRGRPTSEATASFVLDMRSFTRGGIRPRLFGSASITFGAHDGDLSVELNIYTRAPATGSSSSLTPSKLRSGSPRPSDIAFCWTPPGRSLAGRLAQGRAPL